MPIGQAELRVGHAMRDYIMARKQSERDITHADFYAMKHAFRTTYGSRQWRQSFDWIIEEWELHDYIFDREALRDS